MILTSLVFVHDLYSAHTMGCSIESDRVVIKYGLYRKEIPFKAIEEADITGLSGEYAPRFKTLGIALGGYKVGWFRLKGYPKALLFIGRGSSELVLLRSGGIPVLIGVENPDKFLRRLRLATGR